VDTSDLLYMYKILVIGISTNFFNWFALAN